MAYGRNVDTHATCHISYVVISVFLRRDVIMGHPFQHNLINFLITHFLRIPNYIYLFSGRSAVRCKNTKTFINLCRHHTDIHARVERHFFTTLHDKDSVVMEQSLSNDSLCVSSQILLSHRSWYQELRQWFSDTVSSSFFHFTIVKEYEEEEMLLYTYKRWFVDICTISGTEVLLISYHSWN